jgi:hypothetical protein
MRASHGTRDLDIRAKLLRFIKGLAEKSSRRFTTISHWFRPQLFAPGLATVALLGGCAKSSNPQITEIIKTKQPTFGGLVSASFTTASATFSVSGECDKISKGIEYSLDQSTWTSVAPDCASGTFSFNVVLQSVLNLYVRAKTKNGFTPAAHAYVRLLLPPTSPSMEAVSAGMAGQEGIRSVSSTMSSSMTGVPMDDGSLKKMHTQLAGTVYGQ